jgi:tRNA modification GTPase
MRETIFAPLTIKGVCSIYVLRISGEKTLECLQELGVSESLKHRQATLCNLKDPKGQALDEAILVYYKSPNSFTGEDICELNIHCSNFIIKQVFEILSSIDGVRYAKPGEFSKRAFLNGKLDLTQAEAIVDLIASETELQHQQALKQLKGFTGKVYKKWRKDIVKILSLLEAYINFPEEEIDENIQDEIKTKVEKIKQEIIIGLEDNKVGEKIRDGLLVTIMGEPNTGKSSLINYLAKRDVAIVSEIAGTTRDVLEIALDFNGIPVRLFDTAGIRETKNIVETEGVKRAIMKAKEADIKILLLATNQCKLTNKIKKLINKNTIVLLNKTDLLDRLELKKLIEKLEKELKTTIMPISIKKQQGINEFINKLQKLSEDIISPNLNSIITRERHRNELSKALKFLKDFSLTKPIELAAEDIRLVANCLGKITGQINIEEILDSIFSKFCIGK